MQATNKQLAQEVSKRSVNGLVKLMAWCIRTARKVCGASKTVWEEARKEADKNKDGSIDVDWEAK